LVVPQVGWLEPVGDPWERWRLCDPAGAPYRPERAGLYRPRLAGHAPHHIPEGTSSELFAALGSHRDRALVAFWVSTGARASELLGALCRDADPGQQLITVIRKGSRMMPGRGARASPRWPSQRERVLGFRLVRFRLPPGGPWPRGRRNCPLALGVYGCSAEKSGVLW
jgi:integrase